MGKLVKKLVVYSLLILIVLEVLVRVFHLHNQLPARTIDENGYYSWVPGETGYGVYGNRRQSFSEYKINKSGYNSYREFKPTADSKEIAIVGDSFVEGFHQDYFNSIGKKIEDQLPEYEVYEYGYRGTDLAQQLYMMSANKETFDLIDHVVVVFKYENDLKRDEFKFKKIGSSFPILEYSKLATYIQNIGLSDPVREIFKDAQKTVKRIKSKKGRNKSKKNVIDQDSLYLENFKGMVSKYGINKDKTTFLLDSRVTNGNFIAHLRKEKIKFIDYAKPFEKTNNKPTNLIYDHHWNNLGRTIIANEIVEYVKNVN